MAISNYTYRRISHKYFDLGGGYFKAIESGPFIFETYGGVGFGHITRITNTFLNNSYNDMKFIKYYVQPSLGYKTNVLELAISWRLAALNFTKIENTGVVSGADLTEIQIIQNNPTSVLSEPAVTARLGFKAVKLQGQWGWSSNLSHPDYPQGRSYFSLGVFIAIERKNK